MRCPNCQQALHEHSLECAHCGFSVAAAERLFGISPQLDPKLSDLAGVLTRKDRSNIRESLLERHTLFPQLRFAVVLTRLAQEISLRSYTFWLFNRSTLATAMEKGGNCRLILLTVDVESQRVTCMVGYGLEPFVNDLSLSRIVDSTLPAMRKQDYASAILTALQQAEAEFSLAAKMVPQTYGLHEEAAATGDGSWQGRESFAY